MFQALAAVGIGHEQADEIVSTLEAGRWPAPTPDLREQRPARVRAAVRGRLARWCSRRRQLPAAHRRPHRQRRTRARRLLRHAAHPPPAAGLPAPEEAPVEKSAPAAVLDAKDVLAAAERFPWALAARGRVTGRTVRSWMPR
ncbi:hypothetical protein NKH18_00015 [Streptomyces sp. M10(2022)]